MQQRTRSARAKATGSRSSAVSAPAPSDAAACTPGADAEDAHPKNVLRPVVSRLKVMGGCDISNGRTPQDGRFSVHGRDRHVDVRLTTLPTSTGEAVYCGSSTRRTASSTSGRSASSPTS